MQTTSVAREGCRGARTEPGEVRSPHAAVRSAAEPHGSGGAGLSATRLRQTTVLPSPISCAMSPPRARAGAPRWNARSIGEYQSSHALLRRAASAEKLGVAHRRRAPPGSFAQTCAFTPPGSRSWSRAHCTAERWYSRREHASCAGCGAGACPRFSISDISPPSVSARRCTSWLQCACSRASASARPRKLTSVDDQPPAPSPAELASSANGSAAGSGRTRCTGIFSPSALSASSYSMSSSCGDWWLWRGACTRATRPAKRGPA